MQRPLFSVITITRNNKDALQKTVGSVLEQDYAKIEYIVVDGASTDGTAAYLASLDERKAIKWLSEPDDGIAQAFNKGMALAGGDMVIFMNAGDVFVSSRTLSKIADLIPAEVNVKESVVYGHYYDLVDSEYYLVRADHQTLHANCGINHQASFIGADLCRRYKYDERLVVIMDYDYWLRLFAAGVPFIKIEIAVAQFDANGVTGSPTYRVHVAILSYFLVALNTRRKLSVTDAFNLLLLACRVHLSVCLRQILGRPVILGMKRFLARFGLKPAPLKDVREQAPP